MSSDRTVRADLRSLLALAWPVILARATQSVIGFCDALMVAPLGEESLAAVSTGSLNTFAFVILPMGTVFIVQSFVAQLRGRGELESVPRYAWYGLATALLAQLFALVALPFVPAILGLFDYAPRVHAEMSTYLTIRLLSIAAVVGIEALGNWYGGLGNTRPALVAGVISMVGNVLGNYLLIEPRLGLPGYGVVGAAWASTLASWLGFASLLYLCLTERAPSIRRVRGLAWSELVRMLRFGLPNGVNWFLEFSAFALFINLVVAHLGTTVLAAFNVVLQINPISFMPAFGLASAGAILIGEAIGRRAHDEVWPILRLTGQLACGWMGTVAVVYFTCAAPLMALFEPTDLPADSLLAIGGTMLRYAALWQLFDAVAITVSEGLRAAGDTSWPMYARIVLAWVVFTPAAWWAVMVLGGGVDTVMIAVILYMAVLAGLLALRFASNRWRAIELVDDAAV